MCKAQQVMTQQILPQNSAAAPNEIREPFHWVIEFLGRSEVNLLTFWFLKSIEQTMSGAEPVEDHDSGYPALSVPGLLGSNPVSREAYFPIPVWAAEKRKWQPNTPQQSQTSKGSDWK
jgi:hypothetical protein